MEETLAAEENITQSPSGINAKSKNIARYLLMALVLLLPLWLMPISGFGIALSKLFLIFVLTLAAVIFYLVYLLQVGRIKYLRSFIFLALLAIILITLISSLFSGWPLFSFAGKTAEMTAFSSLAILALLLFLTFSLFRSEEHMLKLLFLLFISAFILFFCQFLHIAFGLTFFNLLPSTLSSFIGSWSELSIFFGLIALISVVFLQFLGSRMSQIPRGRFWHAFLICITILSLLAMAFVNFRTGWLVFGIFLLLLFVSSFATSGKSRNFAKLPLFLMILSLIFILASNLVGDFLSGLGLNYVEVHPSWSATIDVVRHTLLSGTKNFILGSGPSSFVYDWLLFKPTGINQTIFWNLRFGYGIGILPSLIATVGILGGLSWLLFLFILAYYGFRAVTYNGDEISKSLLFSSFLGTAYLWTFNIIYNTNHFIFALSFIMTGLFLAMLARVGKVTLAEFDFFKKPNISFISSLSIVLLLILAAVSFYMVFQKSWAVYSYGKALDVLNREGNLAKAGAYLNRALLYDHYDGYYRALGQVDLLNLSNLIRNQKQLSKQELSANFQNILARAVQNMQMATKANPKEPLNWQALASVYQNIIPLQVKGAYEAAVNAYKEAQKRSPFDPQILFNLANVEIQNGSNDVAKDYLKSALKLKSNYTSALFLLAQITAQEGDLDSAIQQTEAARLTAPNDTGILFQLGLLYYQKKDYSDAVSVLKRAVLINPNYANALYFLGLSYDKTGQKQDAIKQFEKVAELNPDNQEVKTILSNLKSGKPALSSISPPKPAPEERSAPPVEEKSEE